MIMYVLGVLLMIAFFLESTLRKKDGKKIHQHFYIYLIAGIVMLVSQSVIDYLNQ